MRHLLIAALLASGPCNPVVVTQPPDPVTDYPPDVGDAGVTAPTPDLPEEPCGMAWATMADAECAPVEGQAAWLAACANLPSETLRCVMTVESCAAMRTCLDGG